MNTQTDIRVHGLVFSQKYHKCNKPICHCHDQGNPGHGPYWHATPDTGGPSKYIGKSLPDWVLKHMEALKDAKAQIAKLKARLEKESRETYHKWTQLQEQLSQLHALERGGRINAEALKKLGLAQFASNGHK